jgi:hypothetical protein
VSVLADATGLLDRIALSSPQQRWLRVTALVSGLAFLGLSPAAGGGFHPVLSGAALVPLLFAVLMPESNAPLGLVLYLGGLWVVAVPRMLGVEVLLAAVVLAALHLACALASYGPPGLTLDGSFLALWWRRFGYCVGGAGLVWLLSRALVLLDLPPSGLALGAALVLVLGWVTVLTVRLTGGGRT